MIRVIFAICVLATQLSYGLECSDSVSIERLPYHEFKAEHVRYETDKAEYGQYHTVFQFHNLPREGEYEFQIKRSLKGSGKYETCMSASVEDLYKISDMLQEEFPIIVISGRGFLPGESVDILLKVDGENHEEIVSYIPNPILQMSETDEAQVSAELKNADIGTYLIRFENFIEGETLRFESISGREKISDRIPYSDGMMIQHMPGVAGGKGGKCQIIITREDGERITISLPWGMQLIPFLEGRRYPV